jgi:hypothetical protein
MELQDLKDQENAEKSRRLLEKIRGFEQETIRLEDVYLRNDIRKLLV